MDKEWDPSPEPECACYKIDFPSDRTPLTFVLNSQVIQEPEETFDLRFTSTSRSLAGHGHTDYVCELSFDNNVHEICQDYYYEIALRTNSKHCRIKTILAIAVKRISKAWILRGTYNLGNVLELNNYTFYIRRYKDKKPRKNIDKGESIGCMLWLTGAYSDISLIVGDKILRVHKEVLSQKSEVFKSMFAHEMAESQNGIVKIDDLDVQVVEEMLTYIYTGRAANIARMPRELFEAAHRYQLDELQNLCEEHVIFSLNYENVLDILDMADLYDLKDLQCNAKLFVQNHEEEMVRQPSYRRFLCEALKTDNAVETLLFADRNQLDDVKKEVLKFVKDHVENMMERDEFLDLFNTQPNLIKTVFVYIYEKAVASDSSN